MSHVSDQLKARGIEDVSESFLQSLARNVKTSCAILIKRNDDKRRSLDGSNGQNVVLIARNGRACTIMNARDNQMTKEHFRVDEIR